MSINTGSELDTTEYELEGLTYRPGVLNIRSIIGS